MKLVKTLDVEENVLREFFDGKWEEISNQQSLKKFGYLVKYQDEYKGFFALSPVENNSYWLKSLYIKDGVPASFPLAVLESAIALAKEQAGNSLFIHSHQSVLDTLLSLLKFESSDIPKFAEYFTLKQGQWWIKQLDTSVYH
ncbi:hypothetical protein [Sediminibacillus massiliensis]|uniref:hypothetical protein n=1 Tax=Sediminibacillus massiliensis TaxID=1926277 RepID=UPI000988726D|nr:hypothetical protein [Sediminibacillus massiliensis]